MSDRYALGMCGDRGRRPLRLAVMLGAGGALLAIPVVVRAQRAPSPRVQSQPPMVLLPLDEAEVVVTARRRGEPTVTPETEYDEAAIAARGADSIGTLLERLRPFIDDSGEQPVLLVNGRPLGLDRALLSFPPEALEKLAVLPPEAAARYGEPPGRRIVNLVLKPRFASLDAEAGLFGSTRGGQPGAFVNLRRAAVAGETRWNANLRAERQGALLRSERDLPPRPGGSASDAFETLLSSRRAIVANAGLSRPIGAFTGSINLDASDRSSAGLRGLSPGGNRPLRSSTGSQTIAATTTLSGSPGGFQTNFSTILTRSWSDSVFESAGGGTSNRGRSDTAQVRLNVNKALFALPAGPVTAATTLDLLANRTRNVTGAADDAGMQARKRRQLDGNLTLGVPLSGARGKTPGRLGRLALRFTGGIRSATGGAVRTETGAGVVWAPVPAIELRGDLERAGTAPTIDQLDGPLVTNPVRIFDYRRAEAVEVARLTGGNPLLGRGNRRETTVALRLLPFGDQRLAVSTRYRSRRLRGGVASFPELTPAVEAIFPERVGRDGDGRLISLDARPIAIASDDSAELFSSVTVRPGAAARGQPGGAAAPQRWTVDLSLSHRYRLRDRLLIADGLPVIDRLGGTGGQSRHTVSAQANVSRSSVGINGALSWNSPARIGGGSGAAAFRSRPPLLLDLDMYLRAPTIADNGPWYANTLVTLQVQNVLGAYRRVTAADGSTPPGYRRDEIDPAGRSMRLVFRKRF